MLLIATIAPKQTADNTALRESREIRAEGADYDTAKAALTAQLSDGWVLLHIRQG